MTQKFDGTLKSDGHANVRLSAPRFDGVTRQSPLYSGESPKFGGQNKICKSIHNLFLLCKGSNECDQVTRKL